MCIPEPKRMPPSSQPSEREDGSQAHVDRRWVERVFASPPCRNVMGRSRPTQRFVFRSVSGQLVWCEGGNEATAALLLEHLARMGIVKRYKLQPFRLSHFDPSNKAVPDLLIELLDGRLVVVEVKARRYLSPDVQERLEINEILLSRVGLPFRLWTDKDPLHLTDKLNSIVWSNVRILQKGRTQELDQASEQWIRDRVQTGARTLPELMSCGHLAWDALIAALARGIINIDPNKVFDEHATLQTTYPSFWWQHLFSEGPVLATWFDSLPDS